MTPNPTIEKQMILGIEANPARFEHLSELKSQAMELVANQSLPNHKNEEFKYTSLAHLDKTIWVAGSGEAANANDVKANLIGSFDQAVAVIVNGEFRADLSYGLEMPGVTIESLAHAIDSGKTSDLIGKIASVELKSFDVVAHLGRLVKPEIHLTSALNTAAFTDGCFIHVNKNSTIEKPIQVLILSSGENVVTTPRILFVAEQGCEVTLIETYATLGKGKSLTLPVVEAYIHPNAKAEHIRFQNENLHAQHVALTEIYQDQDSTYKHYNIVFGGALTRNDINAFVDGSNTHLRADGVICLSGDQLADTHTRLDHAKPHCESFEIYKHLLDGNSTAVFNGKIFVHQDAQKTDAKQTNQAVLLSPTATMNSKPQLEIFADDVKCTHGATIGNLRTDAMFYMQARGINAEQARALLVYAFAAEVFEQIEHVELRQDLEQRLFVKLGTEKS